MDRLALMNTTTKQQAWAELVQQNERVKRETENLETAVREARTAGASWEAIGKALDLSKQTTFNRYKHLDKPSNDVQKHHEQAVKFLDGTAPAKPPMAKGTSKKGKTPALDNMNTSDPRPSFTLHSAGRKDGVAQPGTGKGPHACPRCGSTNHKSAKPNKIHAYPGECKPTKYDPQDIADVLTNYLKASK